MTNQLHPSGTKRPCPCLASHTTGLPQGKAPARLDDSTISYTLVHYISGPMEEETLTVETSGINSAENIHKCDERFRGRRRLGGIIMPGRNSDGEPGNATFRIGEEQQWATAYSIDIVCSYDCDQKRETIKADIDICLFEWIRDACCVEDGAEKVRYYRILQLLSGQDRTKFLLHNNAKNRHTITGPLSKDRNCTVAS